MISAVRRALRPHQWLKNVLIATPMLAAHKMDVPTATAVALAFVSFSLCASGGYILNDLLDVTADRLHHRKRHRPFASGQLSVATGISLVLACWVLGFGIAVLWLPPAFVLISAGYLAITAAYSIRIKREPVLDVMVLAGLYVVRIVAGGYAADVPVSTWLLTFMLFISLSLALMKRFIEVSAQGGTPDGRIPGRGYRSEDGVWLHAAGISAGYLSAVILAIYANSPDVTRLYTHPARLVLVCPLLLYWATRTWLRANRHEMHDDPVVAVAQDPVTYLIALAGAAVVLVAM